MAARPTRKPRSGPARVDVAWRVRSRPLDDRAVRRVVRAAARAGGRPAAWLSVVLVSDRELARLHRQWLGDPAPTDVITFDLGGDPGGPVGELYVSVERARAVARRRAAPAARELALYLVHGVLHLCGHDDRRERERRRMRVAESRVLRSLGYASDGETYF